MAPRLLETVPLDLHQHLLQPLGGCGWVGGWVWGCGGVCVVGEGGGYEGVCVEGGDMGGNKGSRSNQIVVANLLVMRPTDQ